MSSRSFVRRAAVALSPLVFLTAGNSVHAAWGHPGVTAAGDGSDRGSAAPDAAGTIVAEMPPAEAAPTDPGQSPPVDSIPAPTPVPAAAPAVVAEPRRVADLPPRHDRPRFLVAVSMGTSIDASWTGSTKTFVSPTFAATIGFGEGPLGFGMRLVSSQASGRGADSGPDRLALDVMAALRPWGSRRPAEGLPWGARVLRTITLDGGLAVERISLGALSDLRGGPVFGGNVDLPLTAPATDGELRLRLSVRRMLAGARALGNGQVGDSTEALGGLVVAF